LNFKTKCIFKERAQALIYESLNMFAGLPPAELANEAEDQTNEEDSEDDAVETCCEVSK
jgi:hypothetical protein